MSKSIAAPNAAHAAAPAAAVDAELTAALIKSHLAHAKLHGILSAHIAGALKSIHSLVTEIVASTGKTTSSAEALKSFMTESASKADQAFDRLRDVIDDTRQEQQQLVTQAAHLQDATEGARTMMHDQRELESLGDKASMLGRRIRMVAMNTTIQAMRAGGEDAQTIKVLASEISALAGDVQRLGEQLTDSLEALSNRVDQNVVNGVAKEAGATARMSLAMASQVRELDAAYQEIKNFRPTVWHQVTASAHGVTAHACQTAAGLQHQDIARQRLEQIADTLARMIASDQQLSAALDGHAKLPENWKPVQAEDLRAGYVMADQRTAHEGESDAASTGPAIELF